MTAQEGLDALMSEVREGHVDVLAVYKLDRLGRSLQHLAQLIGEFKSSWHGTDRNVPGNRHERKQSSRRVADARPSRGCTIRAERDSRAY